MNVYVFNMLRRGYVYQVSTTENDKIWKSLLISRFNPYHGYRKPIEIVVVHIITLVENACVFTRHARHE